MRRRSFIKALPPGWRKIKDYYDMDVTTYRHSSGKEVSVDGLSVASGWLYAILKQREADDD